MRELRYGKSFERAFRQLTRRNEILKEKVFRTLELLAIDAHHPSLDTHKLRGVLEGA